MEERRKTPRLTINEQAITAARAVDALFVDAMPVMPVGTTIESLWEELCRLRGKIKKPKKVDAIRLLLEDDRLVGLTIPLLADIIKKVFHRHGVTCDTSDSSIRWYISQKTLEWDIKQRDKSGADINLDDL
jgi:hypothetical protein